ncbi:ATP-binding protein [Algibacter luteus]|uniref:ATP-binding protein n=1 Tax=Algibacter luteus TaxID=1178825 RepID=UPI0025957550|nr:ATP-binding protein [Algibacter luteus]WJJ95915.1 ATP-binding protein [Algibacter luteus]
MLKRLIILNSDIYSKADIELDNCNSLQIVGPNNIGKSTLIYALNFLFIIDGREMTFSGNRTGDKTTFNHYFPSINSSFIIFEIFKNRYYSILVKKNAEGNLDYYKIDSEYKEELYFMETANGQKIRKFDSLLSEFATNGIEHSKFSNRRDVFNFVYQKGKRNNGVVWLNQSVNQDGRGISNNFSKIYKYLINSKLINNDSLKESLIIADNKENESVSFSKKNQKDIQTLLKHNRDIKVIKSIQRSFSDFKELVNQYKGKSAILSEFIFAFNQQYSSLYSELGTSVSKMKTERAEKRTHLNETLNPKEKELNQLIGKITNQIEQKQKDLDSKEKLVLEIKAFEDLQFLEQSFQNLDKDRKNIESQITLIENQNLSSKEIESNIQKSESKISRIKNQVDSYSYQLIHQISDNQKNKELLNRILSTDITSLSSDNISVKIKQTENLMKLFDGAIELPNDFKGKPIESIEELKKQIKQLEKEKEINDKLLPIAKDLEKHRKDLADINFKIKTLTEKTHKLKQLPTLEKELEALKVEFENLIKQKEQSTKDVKLIDEEIRKLNETIEQASKEIFKKEKRIEEIQTWKVELEQLGIKPIEYQSTDSLDNIYKNLKRNFEERREIKLKKDSLFERLKLKTETSFANETDFIKHVDSELVTLEDKQKAIDGLLKNISTQFANPCRTIYSRFEEFNSFITNQFNSKIKKIKISDIDTLKIEIVENEKLIKDLNKIIQIRDLTSELIFDDQSENLNTLNKYLDNQTTITFNDLFDIKLHLHKKGQHKVVDLKNQIESDGTDKMIRLVLIMSIINQIVVKDDENKIVLFVDEIGTIDEANRIEILNFCKEHNFIPISAAPLHPYDGFDKYYLVRRNKGKIVVSEKNGNVILRKPIEV